MGQSSRAVRQPAVAPAVVHHVLGQPGRPLDPLVASSLGIRAPVDRPAAFAGATGPLRVSRADSAAESEAERLAEPVADGRALLPAPGGFDLSRIRIHTDASAAASARAVGARAYAVGDRIVFGEGQYRPATGEGRRLLAHELVHVASASADLAPALHRYEAPEHQDFGDRGLTDLGQFLQTKDGAEFARKLGNPGLSAELSSDPFFKGRKFTVNGVDLSVGDIVAMAGDFYPSPAALMNADPAELREIRDAIQDERAGKLKGGKANERYQEITQKYIGLGKRAKSDTFIGMAKVNAPHFTPTNRAAWKDHHKQALKAARAAGKDQGKLDAALLIDTFGGHFLTDAFASGHLFDKAALEAEIDRSLARRPAAPPNPEMRSYYAIIGQSMSLVVLKNIHDRLNAEGVEVSNKRGIRWKTFGDDHLKDSSDSLRLGALAVYESRRQVMAANRAGGEATDAADDARSDEVLELLPDQASIDQVTAKAVSYIPWAVETLTPLIYRQRGAGALELKQQWGVAGSVLAPVIKSNIETIANPGREQQLRDLEEQSRRRNAGPLLAPQFTVGTF
ncbi:MAG TPA: DUF4157 domain-containing protein [Candidatus Methylomirabilis sp.]|nr:DUF4157 domain-containing protein [Candidatus Methylomirabilis sp.]